MRRGRHCIREGTVPSMDSKRKAALFSIFAFGLIGICFVLLLHEVVISRELWDEIPRILAGLVAPVPVAVFLAFCFADRGGGGASRDPSPKAMSIVLGITVAFVLGIGWWTRDPGGADTIGMGPVLTQSAVFTSSTLNLLFLRNGPLAAVLSGVSIGLTGFVVFLA